MRRTLASIAVAAAAAAVPTASALPAGAAPAVPSEDALGSTGQLSAGDDVVQLGDSYSAGNGSGTYTERTCWRSPESYGAKVARAAGARYTNVACSGGVVADILRPRVLSSSKQVKTYRIPASQHPDRSAEWLRRARADRLCGTPGQSDWYYSYALRNPVASGDLYTGTLTCSLTARAQISAVSRSTEAVFLTMGGNDLDFATIVTQCLAVKDPSACRSSLSTANARVPTMRARLTDALEAVHERSGGRAHVYLLGYPYLINQASFGIPEAAPSYDAGTALNALQVRGDRNQAAVMRDLDERTGTDDFTFVSVKSAWGWRGHGYDPRTGATNRSSWIVPILAPGTQYQEWVHPRPAGWGASAIALRRATD